MRAKTYAFEADSETVASLRIQTIAELNQGLHSLKRLQAAAESPKEQRALADTVRQLRGILKNLESVPMKGGGR